MNDKVLKNYTTIPSHLYVERSADKQLSQIIEEMQRPGYVLVARQMGKTNLLFNARRNLESDSRKFVYIDLSNNFKTERECYEFIVATILDVLDEELWEIRADIEKMSERTITDHVFYTKSLLKILKHINKDLVLIVDEIDALRTSEYSDNIFAVIRSNYFTRSNFPEFEQLTYILSGVIEPKDLIKDRNKSPFNIGEKIYLDDFSYEEFCAFIGKSGLNLDDEQKNHIFSWANGNPRLTFDICSEVESIIIKNGTIDKKSIDQIIKTKYLKSYDIAPIDHIRELVSEDKSVQEAILQLNSSENEASLSDKMKSKLYLHGIVSLSNDDGVVKIKNRVLQESLNSNWIESLSEDSNSIVVKAIDLIDKSLDYHKGIELLTSVLDSTLVDDITSHSLALYYLGYAEHAVGKYELSNQHLQEKPVALNVSPFMYYRAKLFIGLNFYHLNEIDKGNIELKCVLDNYENNMTWANAALNFSVNNKKSDESIHLLNKITDINDDIKIEVESGPELRSSITIIKSYAYYYLSTLVEANQQLFYLDKAIELKYINHLPYLLLQKARVCDSINEETCNEIVSIILRNQIRLNKDNSSDTAIDYKPSVHYVIIHFCFLHSFDSFKRIYEYSLNELNIPENELAEQVTTTFDDTMKYKFLKFYFEHKAVQTSLELYQIYVTSLSSEDLVSDGYCIEYLDSLINQGFVNQADVVPLSLLIKTCISNKRLNDIGGHLEKLEILFYNLDDEYKYESSILFYWTFEYYLHLNQTKNTHKFGNEVLTRLSVSSKDKTLITNEGEKAIRTRVLQVLDQGNALPIMTPVRNKAKYGRNDKITVRYKDGTSKMDKFKKLQSDIDSGSCEIID